MNKQLSNQDTKWLDGKGSSGDPLTSALDVLYTSGPGVEATRLAEVALQNSLSKILSPIYYDRIDDTPVGPVWLAAGPRGLVGVEYNGSEENFLNYLRRVTKGQPQRSGEKVAAAKKMLLTYLRGGSKRIDVDVDLSGITPFQRRVLEETRKVPRGQVSTYAEIARRIGNPKAVRAVGQALRRNPVPIVVPCHRVIASDGSLGGYGGELRSKRKVQLLKLEGVAIN
ncbi:MAG: methylated-DNA--[protein]-cysteine S-methyltransferase [Chloroflexi bacterium]|nr:methylated-DNA--[protein]-cysteine S-methyltransferase [Chloroflexota bacterium]